MIEYGLALQTDVGCGGHRTERNQLGSPREGRLQTTLAYGERPSNMTDS